MGHLRGLQRYVRVLGSFIRHYRENATLAFLSNSMGQQPLVRDMPASE